MGHASLREQVEQFDIGDTVEATFRPYGGGGPKTRTGRIIDKEGDSWIVCFEERSGKFSRRVAAKQMKLVSSVDRTVDAVMKEVEKQNKELLRPTPVVEMKRRSQFENKPFLDIARVTEMKPEDVTPPDPVTLAVVPEVELKVETAETAAQAVPKPVPGETKRVGLDDITAFLEMARSIIPATKATLDALDAEIVDMQEQLSKKREERDVMRKRLMQMERLAGQ